LLAVVALVALGSLDSALLAVARSADPRSPALALGYSTYLDGKFIDRIDDLALDSEGHLYVVGSTDSPDFPIVNGFQSQLGGGKFCFSASDCGDAFVMKINARGEIVYSSFLGGSGIDYGEGIGVDSQGYAWVTGTTFSGDFPTTPDAIRTLGAEGGDDAFVAKISPDGSELVYSTFFGGFTDLEHGSGLAVDRDDRVLLTGYTESRDFPIKNALQPLLNGPADAYLSRLTSDGDLDYSTYLGGSGGDYGVDLEVAEDGAVVLLGGTYSADFPTEEPIQPSSGGGSDAFVTKVDPSGSTLEYSTYYGDAKEQEPAAVDLGPGQEVVLVGEALNISDPDFVRTKRNAFVASIDSGGTRFTSSFELGDAGRDAASDVVVASDGSVYVSGITRSDAFSHRDAVQPNNAGGYDGFLVRLASLAAPSDVIYSTYIGGSGNDGCCSLVVRGDHLLLGGGTASLDMALVNPRPDGVRTTAIYLRTYVPALDGCRITGSSASDVLIGSPVGDVLCGRGGKDRIRGGRGRDSIRGGSGADHIAGGSGVDRCRGGGGEDDVRGCET